jgi:hypothetical protein
VVVVFADPAFCETSSTFQLIKNKNKTKQNKNKNKKVERGGGEGVQDTTNSCWGRELFLARA